MGIVGDLDRYTRFQAAEAIEASANNPGGGNAALDLAMGLALGQQVTRQMQEPGGGAPRRFPSRRPGTWARTAGSRVPSMRPRSASRSSPAG